MTLASVFRAVRRAAAEVAGIAWEAWTEFARPRRSPFRQRPGIAATDGFGALEARCMRGFLLLICVCSLAVAAPAVAYEIDPAFCALHHPTSDAWWTGPMLANTPETAPHGHYLLEPYIYDVSTQGKFGANGARHSASHANNFGNLTYIVYGLTDTWGVGVIPTGGYNELSGSSGRGFGDLTLQAQHRFVHFTPCKHVPSVSLAVQQTLPTAKYDQLGQKPANGFGAGAWTTNLGLYSQYYFWMPNRRILRMRVNLSEALSSVAPLKDASVYGTGNGFRGEAKPGNVFLGDLAWEYSLTRRWVAALDATYRHANDTRVNGYYLQTPQQTVRTGSGSSEAVGFAPAVEYNFNSRVGVLLGSRVIVNGRNTSETITPAVAINYVH